MKQSNNSCRITYIYGLYCPLSGEIRYVGKADYPRRRYAEHLAEGSRYRYDAKTAWINDVLRSGSRPILKILKVVRYEKWRREEQEKIKHYAARGCMMNWEAANPSHRPTSFPRGPHPVEQKASMPVMTWRRRSSGSEARHVASL